MGLSHRIGRVYIPTMRRFALLLASCLLSVFALGCDDDATVVGPRGPAGEAGAVGPQGPQGERGAAGEHGALGTVGPVGNVGPVGPVGPKGADGSDGVDGKAGPIGPAGLAGAPGAAGKDGLQGAPGPAGIAGPAGADGLPKSKADVYSVTVSAFLPANGQGQAVASCADTNDILMLGGCEQDPFAQVTAFYGVNNASFPSAWVCKASNQSNASGVISVTAHATCISVP